MMIKIGESTKLYYYYYYYIFTGAKERIMKNAARK